VQFAGRIGDLPVTTAAPTLADYQNAVAFCDTATNRPYDNSDIGDGLVSLCINPSLPAGTADYDNADVTPRDLQEDPGKSPIAGQVYVVRMDLNGEQLDRLVVYDDNAPNTGPISEVEVIEPATAADTAIITAKAGLKDAGKPFVTGAGVGATIDLTAQADGTIKGEVAVGGTNYTIGDRIDIPGGGISWGAAMTGTTRVVVTRLGGAYPLGSWRILNAHNWIKPLAADLDQQYGMEIGDTLTTTEKDHEELAVWNGTTWVTVVSTDQIKAWIASLSLFEGTVKQVGGAAVPGAVELTALVNLADVTPAGITAGMAKVSHYWTWVGQAGYAITAADPHGVGRDLNGAIMQVGDWLQIANRGTAVAPILVWVHIGGDLLAKSRADVLYGINNWKAGNYEQGSLVNYRGSLWRATGIVTPADTEPGTVFQAGTPAGPGGVPPAVPDVNAAPWAVIPLEAGVHNVPTDMHLPFDAPAKDIYLVLNSVKGGGKPALFAYDPGPKTWVLLGGGGGGKAMTLSGGQEIRSVGVPVGTVMPWLFGTAPPGWLLCDGSAFNGTLYPELASLIPGLKTPDLRGAYLRGSGLNAALGWGDAANAAGGHQEDATALPKKRMFTDVTGGHAHNVKLQGSGMSGGPWEALIAYSNVPHNYTTSTEGNHYHHLDTGGDEETRPKTIFADYIIKCSDQIITLVA
jgi:hypothetical protein